MRIPSLIPVLLWVVLAGCAGDPADYPRDPEGAPGPASGAGAGAETGTLPATSPPLPSPSDASALRVVFLGTSLTEGYGLEQPETDAWPARIGEMARSAGREILVVNAGLAGETSAGSLRRVDWVLQQEPDVFVLETGANDGLRALSVEDLEANLDAILARVEERWPATRLALVAMEAPPNLGAPYTEAFREIFPRVAERHGATLVPFPLDGVAGVPERNQGDGIHPTAEGHRLMARNAWPFLESILGPASEVR